MDSYMKEIENCLPAVESLDVKDGEKGHGFDELQPTDSSVLFRTSEDHWCKMRTRNQLLSNDRKSSIDPCAETPFCEPPKHITRKQWSLKEDEILFTRGSNLAENNEWDKLLEMLPGRSIGAMRKRYLDGRRTIPLVVAPEIEQKERCQKRRRGSSVAKFDSDQADKEVAESEAVVPPTRQTKRSSLHNERSQDTYMVVDTPGHGIAVSASSDSFPDEHQMYAEYMRSTFACVSNDTRESSFSIQREIYGSNDEGEDEVLPFPADVLAEEVLEEDDVGMAEDGTDNHHFHDINASIAAPSSYPVVNVWHQEDEAFVRSVLDCLSSDAPPPRTQQTHHHGHVRNDLFPDDGDHTIDDLGSSICDFGQEIDDDLFWNEPIAPPPAPSKGYGLANTRRHGHQQQQQQQPEEYWSKTARRYETRSSTQLRREVENMVPNYNCLMPPKVVYVPCYCMKSGGFTSLYVANHHSFSGLSRPPPGYHLVHVPALITTGQAMQVASYPDFPLKFVR